MSETIFAALCASAFCIVVWGVMAAGAGALAQWRMRRVEAELGRPALPAHEWPLIWYAGASIVWLAALVLALLGLGRREWARAGRNCLLLLLAHFTVVTLGATAMVVSDADGRAGDPLPLILLACSMVAFGAISATIFTWRFAGLRATRIESQHVDAEERGSPPGLERIAIYVVSAILWPAGFAAAVYYSKPENVRVGSYALRISVLQVALIALAVCVGLPFLVRALTAQPMP